MSRSSQADRVKFEDSELNKINNITDDEKPSHTMKNEQNLNTVNNLCPQNSIREGQTISNNSQISRTMRKGILSARNGNMPGLYPDNQPMVTEQMHADLNTLGRTTDMTLTILHKAAQENFQHRVKCNFKGRCAVTGFLLPQGIADAAYIEPFTVAGNMNTSNGLYLEVSLQRMYETGLMGIDPDTLSIHFAIACLHKKYYEGCILQSHAVALDSEKLNIKWKWYQSK